MGTFSEARAAANKVSPGAPPAGTTPGECLALLLDRGRLPHMVVPYPRFDEAGQPICDVMVRLLTCTEQNLALANGRAYVAEKLRTNAGDLPWPAKELEDNARIEEILAVSCRNPKDPAKPFFEGGVAEVRRHAVPKELTVLSRTYARIASDTHPSLIKTSEADLRTWIEVAKAGFLGDPFSYLSDEALKTLCESALTCLAEQVPPSTGTEEAPSSSSSDSDAL